jgi:hypothetical protein
MGGHWLNRSSYKSKLLRAEELAARAPRIVGTVNDYWVQRRKQREAASIKRQATSKKWKLNKFTMDEDVYIEIKD